MNRRAWQVPVAVIVVAAMGIAGYLHWHRTFPASRERLLALMPTDASAVVYVDLAQLRTSPFLAELLAWAPAPAEDADYAQFVKATGFDYEHDLDRLAIAVVPRGDHHFLFGVAQGRFDKAKISAYVEGAAANGEQLKKLPASPPRPAGSDPMYHVAFLGDDRIAVSQETTPSSVLNAVRDAHDAAQWHQRFERLAGTPMFGVVRQTGEIAQLDAQTITGFRSPQLSALLDQLQWITISAKPAGTQLQVVAEGESMSEVTAHQLTELLRGIVILAENGLSSARTRQKLDPAARDAYLELLQGADISTLDRGETKSVRLIFDVTPNFLKAARASVPSLVPATSPQQRPAKPKPLPNPTSPTKKLRR